MIDTVIVFHDGESLVQWLSGLRGPGDSATTEPEPALDSATPPRAACSVVRCATVPVRREWAIGLRLPCCGYARWLR